MLEGDFDAQCEALTLDMFCNHAFVSAVYLNGFQADAIKMQVLGNAFAAYDTAGLTEHYRKICLDKAARLIHVLIGDNYLRVGKEGSKLLCPRHLKGSVLLAGLRRPRARGI